MYKNNYEKTMAEMTPRKMALIMMCPYQFDAIQKDKCGDYDHKCVNCCEDYLMSEVKMMGKFTDADVFRGLECCTKIENPCSDSPFDGECISGDDINILHIYALNLLKRQKVEKEAMLSHIKCLQYENDKLRTRNREAQLEINRQKAEIERLNRALVTQEKQHELKMRLSKRK